MAEDKIVISISKTMLVFFAKSQILKVESVYILLNALVVPPMMSVIQIMFCIVNQRFDLPLIAIFIHEINKKFINE